MQEDVVVGTKRGLTMKRVLALVMVMAMTTSFAYADLININGTGSTFINPAITWLIRDYSPNDPLVNLNYEATDSETGIEQIIANKVDFAATEVPLTMDQIKTSLGHLFYFPVAMGAVAVAYDVPGVDSGLKLTQAALARIYLGQITEWDDPQITQENPGVRIPNLPIVVVHQSNESGTSYIFTDYLSAISSEWKSNVGQGTSVNWPVGLSGSGDEGVAKMIKNTSGSIGYVGLAYVKKNRLTAASLQNKSGNFMEPETGAVVQAVAGIKIPMSLRRSLVNSADPKAYPIVGVTWILIYRHMNARKTSGIVSFIRWAITDGQLLIKHKGYAPLPASFVEKIEKKLDLVK